MDIIGNSVNSWEKMRIVLLLQFILQRPCAVRTSQSPVERRINDDRNNTAWKIESAGRFLGSLGSNYSSSDDDHQSGELETQLTNPSAAETRPVDCDGKSCQANTSQQQVDAIMTFPFIINGIVTPVVFCCGIVFNVVNVYVLFRQGTDSSPIRYLLSLAVVDLAYLLLSLFGWVMFILQTFDRAVFLQIRAAFHLEWDSRLVTIATGRTSNMITVVMSLERFIAVQFPFAVKRSPLSRHPVKIVICVAIFIFAFLIPNALRSEYVVIEDTETNDSTIVWRDTTLAQTNKEAFGNYTYSLLAILRLFPVVSVLLLNTAIVIALKRSSRSRAVENVQDKRRAKQNKLTRLLVAISFLFLVCVTPNLINSLCSNFLPGYTPLGADKATWWTVNALTTLLDLVNSAANFFVYVTMSEKFRHIFMDIFCRTLKPRKAERVTEERQNP